MTMSTKPANEARAEIAEFLHFINSPLEFIGDQPTPEQLKWFNIGCEAMRCRVRADVVTRFAPPHPAAPADAGDAMKGGKSNNP